MFSFYQFQNKSVSCIFTIEKVFPPYIPLPYSLSAYSNQITGSNATGVGMFLTGQVILGDNATTIEYQDPSASLYFVFDSRSEKNGCLGGHGR